MGLKEVLSNLVETLLPSNAFLNVSDAKGSNFVCPIATGYFSVPLSDSVTSVQHTRQSPFFQIHMYEYKGYCILKQHSSYVWAPTCVPMDNHG